jgi:membrane-bound lytic murein transglycosylase B
MQTLTLEYVLDGSRPGYQFTTPTNGIGEAALKTIWRSAMPRGQGWGPGQPNFTAIKEWNKAEVYAKTIALFAEKLNGGQTRKQAENETATNGKRARR